MWEMPAKIINACTLCIYMVLHVCSVVVSSTPVCWLKRRSSCMPVPDACLLRHIHSWFTLGVFPSLQDICVGYRPVPALRHGASATHYRLNTDIYRALHCHILYIRMYQTPPPPHERTSLSRSHSTVLTIVQFSSHWSSPQHSLPSWPAASHHGRAVHGDWCVLSCKTAI